MICNVKGAKEIAFRTAWDVLATGMDSNPRIDRRNVTNEKLDVTEQSKKAQICFKHPSRKEGL